MHSDVESGSQQETQKFRIPTRRFKNLRALPRNSGIQDSFQKIQESRIPGKKFKICQEVKRWVTVTNRFFLKRSESSFRSNRLSWRLSKFAFYDLARYVGPFQSNFVTKIIKGGSVKLRGTFQHFVILQAKIRIENWCEFVSAD